VSAFDCHILDTRAFLLCKCKVEPPQASFIIKRTECTCYYYSCTTLHFMGIWDWRHQPRSVSILCACN